MWYFTYWVLNIIIKLLCLLAGRSAVGNSWWPSWGWGSYEPKYVARNTTKASTKMRVVCYYIILYMCYDAFTLSFLQL